MFDTLLHKIGELACLQPDKAAVIFKKESLSYKELYRKALSICGQLETMGILPGDRICFSAVSKPEMVAAYLGIHACGAVAVFLDKGSTPEHVIDIYHSAGAKLLLTDKSMKELGSSCVIASLREVYAKDGTEGNIINRDADDLAEILFTTGTTGKPKGVMLSFKAVYHILMNTLRGCGYSDETVMLLPLPLNHSFALRILRAVLYAGGTIVLQNGFTFAKEAENNILNFQCNAIACVPASYELMKSQMQDAFPIVMSNLSSFEAGAGSLSIAQRRDLVRMLPNVRFMNVWGSSESGGAIFCNVNEVAADDGAVGSLGKPIKGVEVCFLYEDAPFDQPEMLRGRLADYQVNTDAAHPGRMAVKGNMLMSGYWNDPVKTAETLIDGWLITGDLAYVDEHKNIHMLGRADDIIKMGGENISPVELENIVEQNETIRECACIGVPDELLGQIPVLFIITRKDFDEVTFKSWLSGQIEHTKLPQKIIRLDEIPRNRMGKIDRKELHKLWDNRETLDLMNPVIDTILARRSIRKFTDQDIPREMLNLILKCGYHAPSGHNMQSWRFTVLTKGQDILQLKLASSIAAKNKKIAMYGFENPKAIILVSNDSRNPDGCQDASCAAENMMLAAQSFGLGSVWLNMLMTLRNESPVKELLDSYGIPENHIVWAAVALGWTVAEGARLQKKENVVVYI